METVINDILDMIELLDDMVDAGEIVVCQATEVK
jgi:hypothetical protein